MSVFFVIVVSFLQIVAHEIGHNLGMYHDFTNTGGNKFDSKGQACTGIGGYMDYVSNPTKWSTCSVEDYTKYYNSVQPWCLTPRKLLLLNYLCKRKVVRYFYIELNILDNVLYVLISNKLPK